MDEVPAQNNITKAKSFFSPKIVFVILGVVVLVELIYAIRALTLPTSPLSTNNINAKKSVARISLTSPKTSFKIAERIPVSVILNSATHAIGGADLIVHYDPKILEATPAGIIKGKIFDEYPLIAVDASKGLISISGVSSLKNSFTGTGDFAIINLRGKVAGKTSLTVDFSKGSTTASNLVEVSTSQNILEQVDNLELNIQ